MPTATSELSRTEAVRGLFDELLRFSRSLRAHTGEWSHAVRDLTRGEIIALGVLERHETTRPGQVATAMGVDPSVVSRQLAGLDRLQLIERCVDPTDRRAELVSITPRGRERLAQARAAMCEVLADRLGEWDLDSISRAAAAVAELAEMLTDTPDPAPAADPLDTAPSKDPHA